MPSPAVAGRQATPAAAAVLQATTDPTVAPAPATPLALAGTFVVTALVFAFTAHVAARHVLGAVPVSRALAVGTAPAATVVALIRYPPGVLVLAGLLADVFAMRYSYRLSFRRAGWVALVHFTVTIVLTLAVTWTLAFVQLAPG